MWGRMSWEQQDGRICAEHRLLPSPHSQICIHRRVVQHFAELDTTSLLCLFLGRFQSLWDRGLAAQVGVSCTSDAASRCVAPGDLGSSSERKQNLSPADVAVLLGEGSCFPQGLCSCPHPAEIWPSLQSQIWLLLLLSPHLVPVVVWGGGGGSSLCLYGSGCLLMSLNIKQEAVFFLPDLFICLIPAPFFGSCSPKGGARPCQGSVTH